MDDLWLSANFCFSYKDIPGLSIGELLPPHEIPMNDLVYLVQHPISWVGLPPIMIMPHHHVALKSIPPPEPNSRLVFRPKVLPAFMGEDDTHLICPECYSMIIQGIDPENWLLATFDGRPVVIRCVCGTYVEAPLKTVRRQPDPV